MSNTQQNPDNNELRFNTDHDQNKLIQNTTSKEEQENNILNQIIEEKDNNVYTAMNTPLFNTPQQQEEITEEKIIEEPTQNNSENITQTELSDTNREEIIQTRLNEVENSKEPEENAEEEITELQNPIINTSIQQPTSMENSINNIETANSPNFQQQVENSQEATQLHQENNNQNNIELTLADKLFSFFAKLGLPILLLLTLIFCGQQILFPRDFWYAEEVRFADIYMNMLSSNNFLMLTLNGQPYAETGPLYYYLVRIIDLIPAIDMPQAFFLATIFSTMLLVSSTWLLTRSLGYSNKIAFCAGLIVLSCLTLASFSYYTRMDFLFASLLNYSYLCFYRAWKKESAPIWLIFAFIFLALACLSQTLLFFILPFAASLLFFIWTSKIKRINSADGILGFLLAILIFFAWFGYIYMQGKADYISLILNQQLIQLFAVPNFNETNFYLLLIPLAFLPFTFTFFFADWINWFKNIGQSIKNRKQDNASAWIFILILCHFVLFLLFKQTISSLIAILILLAILSAKIIMNFNILRKKLFFSLTALFTFLLGISLILSEFQTYIFKFLPIAQDLVTKIPFVLFEANAHTSYGLAAIGTILTLLGLILFVINKKSLAGGTVLTYALGIIIAFQPITLLLTPQISSVLSPKKYAYEMANQHKTQNVTPVTLGIPANIFTYYFNDGLDPINYQRKVIHQLSNHDELTDFLLNNETIILAIPEQEFKQITYKDEAIILPYHQYIGTKKILLTIWQISSQSSILKTKKEQENILSPIDNLLEQKEKEAIINVQPNEQEKNNQENLLPNTNVDQLSPTNNNENEISL